MNFTNNLTSIIDPSHGMLSQFTQPDKAAGAASKASLKSANMVPGLGMVSQSFAKSSPNTAGLQKAKTTRVEMSGSGYSGTVKAAKKEHDIRTTKSGTAQAAINNYKKLNSPNSLNSFGFAKPSGCIVPHTVLRDMRKLASPNALDESLAGML